jgi:hypoxanthine phosphoribosyltransferase
VEVSKSEMLQDQKMNNREILIAQETIQSRVYELAQEISSDYADEEPIMIGILNGVVFFFVDLVKALTIPITIDFIRASSYGSGTISKGTITYSKDVEIDVKDKHVIIVEDIVDTGLTLNQIIKRVEKKGPKSIRICALIDKGERRSEEVALDYSGFQVEKGFLVGYGLDHDERYRYLPDIFVLK